MDQTEKPIKTQYPEPEEEVHRENSASKMFRKVKARAKKFKNSITKHGQSHQHDHDVAEEDDEDDELEPEVIGASVRGGVTGQPESLSHPIEANVPAPEKIVPPGAKVFPVVSSDYTKPIEPLSLQDTSYGHEALSDPVRTTDISDREERREEPTHHHPLGVAELSDREESRVVHHEPMETHVSLLSTTEDVTSSFAPGGEDEYLVGQRKVNVETPKKMEEDPFAPGGGSDYLSGVSNYGSKVNDLTHESGEAEVPEIAESLGSLKVTDEFSDRKSGFERDLPTRSHEVDRETESAIGKDSPVCFGVKFGAESEKDFPTRRHEFDTTTESRIDKNSPSRSHEFDLKTESGVNKNSPTGFGGESKTGLEEDSPTRSYESDQKTESEINKNSPTGLCSASIVGLGEDIPAKSHELCLKNESGSGKDSPMGFGRESGTILGEDIPVKESHGYGEESEAELEKKFPSRSDDLKVETDLGRDLPTETRDQFSPELSHPKERDDFEESRDNFEETRDETQETKQSTYTEHLAFATSAITNKAIAAKNAVASKLGYSGESPVGDDTVDENLTPVNETETELPLSGGGSDLEEKQQGKVDKGTMGFSDSGRSELRETGGGSGIVPVRRELGN